MRLKANGDLNVKHGSITANLLQASSPENMKLNLEYGKNECGRTGWSSF